MQREPTTCPKNAKQAHDKRTKPRNYAPGKKVCLNSKYIKTKRNWKLEAKFFGPFQVFYPMGRQAYKLELPKWWRIHNIFHVFLLEQDTLKKEQVDKKTTEQLEFEAGGNNEEYKIESICDSAVYARESETGNLPGLYYLVSWESYLKDKNPWEPTSVVQHLRKLVSIFHIDHTNKPIIISLLIDMVPPMAKCTILSNINSKQKRSRPIGSVQKKAKH